MATFGGVNNVDELIARLQDYKTKKAGAGGGGGHQRQVREQRRTAGDRPPPRCYNFGETHEARVCPKPLVPV